MYVTCLLVLWHTVRYFLYKPFPEPLSFPSSVAPTHIQLSRHPRFGSTKDAQRIQVRERHASFDPNKRHGRKKKKEKEKKKEKKNEELWVNEIVTNKKKKNDKKRHLQFCSFSRISFRHEIFIFFSTPNLIQPVFMIACFKKKCFSVIILCFFPCYLQPGVTFPIIINIFYFVSHFYIYDFVGFIFVFCKRVFWLSPVRYRKSLKTKEKQTKKKEKKKKKSLYVRPRLGVVRRILIGHDRFSGLFPHPSNSSFSRLRDKRMTNVTFCSFKVSTKTHKPVQRYVSVV